MQIFRRLARLRRHLTGIVDGSYLVYMHKTGRGLRPRLLPVEQVVGGGITPYATLPAGPVEGVKLYWIVDEGRMYYHDGDAFLPV